ncbi:MAG: MFS transporter [bacterium]|nr:MFS transporter [bacterium]MDE0287368.1 MFS transporter [bacterium]MDE0439189.1 MFS transporter [bacterium]
MTHPDTNPLRSFREPNVRIFFSGLAASGIGMWAETTAVVLLVRELGGQGLELGIVTACQFLPLMLLGLYAGAVADRSDRRRLIIIVQGLMGIEAVLLGLVDLADLETLPIVYFLSLVSGTLNAFSNPARRTLSTELVPDIHLANVVSLGTSVITGSRIVGPAVAALMAARFGTGLVFVAAAVSHVAFLIAITRMDTGRFHPLKPAPPSRTPIRDGLREVWGKRSLRVVLVVFGVVSTVALNFQVGFPLLVADRLMEDEVVFGWLLSAMSVGNVMGALVTARLTSVSVSWPFGTAAAVAVTLGAVALAPSTFMAFVFAVPLGMSTAALVTSSTLVIQQRTDPRMRSRVLALTTVLFLGSKPLGGPITGLVGDAAGALWANLYGALIAAAVVAAAVMYSRTVRSRDLKC